MILYTALFAAGFATGWLFFERPELIREAARAVKAQFITWWNKL